MKQGGGINKNLAMSSKSEIDKMKVLTHGNSNEASSRMIKYPKHDGNINPGSTKHQNQEHINKVQIPQTETTTVISKNVSQVDQRREAPRQGYTSSGTDSRGSGGIQNPLKSHQDIDQEISVKPVSYQHNKKPEDRNAQSQDLATEFNKMNNSNGGQNKFKFEATLPKSHANRNYKQKVVRSMEANEEHAADMINYQNYPNKQQMATVTDFQTIEHNPQYSSSSRGYMMPEKSNYSLSPNHTKVPSDNSSRNVRGQGILEHIKTDPSGMYFEGQNSRNKYAGYAISGPIHKNQKYTYETGNFMYHKKMSVKDNQRMLRSSEADEMLIHAQNMHYNTSKRNSQDHTHGQLKSNYNKYVERNYRSGGSGSTSGGASVDGINHFK